MNKILGTGKIINIKCTEVSIPAFPNLLFGTHTDGSDFFDATNYLHSTNSELKLSVEDFFQKFDHSIQAFIKVCEIEPEKLICINSEGHQLINGCLCYLFLSYVDPQFCVYCNDMLNELFCNGFVISDTQLISLIRHRLNPELLKQVWNDEEPMV